VTNLKKTLAIARRACPHPPSARRNLLRRESRRESLQPARHPRASRCAERHAEPQLVLALEIDLVLRIATSKTRSNAASATSFGFRRHRRSFSTPKSMHVAALQIHDNGQFLRAADGDAKLRILQLASASRNGSMRNAEAAFLESVAQFVQIKNAACMEPRGAPVKYSRPEPFEYDVSCRRR